MNSRASPESLELAAELARLPVAESIEDERRAWTAICNPLDPSPDATFVRVDAGGVEAVWASMPLEADCYVLYCHGGAFAIGSSWHHRDMLARLSEAATARVFAVDYRLAPEHPFPSALDDVSTAYRWLLDLGVNPARIVLAGDSCGANLVLGAAIRARDAGDRLPAALVCISPWVDLSQSGFSYETNAHIDPFITADSLNLLAEMYLAGADPTDSRASPAMAELSGLPPVLIQVGAGECLLADSISLAEGLARHGGAAVLEIWPLSVHVWPVWASRAPEAREAIAHIGRFIRTAVPALHHQEPHVASS